MKHAHFQGSKSKNQFIAGISPLPPPQVIPLPRQIGSAELAASNRQAGCIEGAHPRRGQEALQHALTGWRLAGSCILTADFCSGWCYNTTIFDDF